jgi:hypothetical protein
MASIHNDVMLQASAADVWDALRDFGALHQRLVPGFVIDCKLDGTVRVVTFANGLVARESLVDCDDKRRRLAYAIVGGRAAHYGASAQVFEQGPAACRLLWIIDLLPDELAQPVGAMAAAGVQAMQRQFNEHRA